MLHRSFVDGMVFGRKLLWYVSLHLDSPSRPSWHGGYAQSVCTSMYFLEINFVGHDGQPKQI